MTLTGRTDASSVILVSIKMNGLPTRFTSSGQCITSLGMNTDDLNAPLRYSEVHAGMTQKDSTEFQSRDRNGGL